MSKDNKGEIVDPRKPKRALNAYMLFAAEMRDVFRRNRSHEKLGVVEMAKLCGSIWRSLTPEDKARFQHQAQLAKEYSFLEQERYKAPSQETLEEMYGILPKGLTTPYAFYIKENYKKFQRFHPFPTFGDVARGLADKWRNLTDKEKRPYIQRFEDDLARYRRQMHLYADGLFRACPPGKARTCHCCHYPGRILTKKTRGPVKRR